MIPNTLLQAVEPGDPFNTPLAIILVGILASLAYIAVTLRAPLALFAFAVAIALIGLFAIGLIDFSVLILGVVLATVAVAVVGIIMWEVV